MLSSDRVYEDTSRQSIMRKAVAIALIPLFLILLFAAITLNHVAATISGPEILAGCLLVANYENVSQSQPLEGYLPCSKWHFPIFVSTIDFDDLYSPCEV